MNISTLVETTDSPDKAAKDPNDSEEPDDSPEDEKKIRSSQDKKIVNERRQIMKKVSGLSFNLEKGLNQT